MNTTKHRAALDGAKNQSRNLLVGGKKKKAAKKAQQQNKPNPSPAPKGNQTRVAQHQMQARSAADVQRLCLTDPKLRALVRNMIYPQEAFCIPRIIPTRPAPKRYFGTFKLPVIKTDDNRFRTAFKVKPDPYNFIEYANVDEAADFNLTDTAGGQTLNVNYPAGTTFTLDGTLTSEPPGKLLPASTLNNMPGYHYSNNSREWVPGYKYWPLNNFTVQAPGTLNYTIADFISNKAGNVYVEVNTVDSNGNLTLYLRDTKVVVANATANLTGNIDLSAFNGTDIKGISINLRVSQTASARFNSFSASCQGLLKVRDSLVWRPVSLWDILSSKSAESQFLSAQNYAVTGLSVLLRNASAEMYKNGTVYGGKVQGGTPLPGDFEALTQFISTIPKKYCNYVGNLKKGMHWFYTPDKFQDYEFFNVVNRLENPCPFMVGAVDGGWEVNGTPEFYLCFSINLELIGQDVGLTYMDSPRITGLYTGLISALADVNPFCENPNHLTHIKNAIKKVLTNPDVLSAVGTAVQYGLKAAPLVASLL